MMAAALIQLGRIKGIARPGIAVPLPAAGTPCLLIDCGANPEAKPEHLAKYGIMGAEFASDVLGVDRPRVGLLSIGEEASKGTAVTLEAHALLAASELNFGGNCEGRDVLTGEFQVVVADGFAGNVLLKGLEGAGVALFTQLRAAADSSLRAKIGGLLLRPAVRAIRPRPTRRTTAAPTCWVFAEWSRSRTGTQIRPLSETPSPTPQRASRPAWWSGSAPVLPPPRVRLRAPVSCSRPPGHIQSRGSRPQRLEKSDNES